MRSPVGAGPQVGRPQHPFVTPAPQYHGVGATPQPAQMASGPPGPWPFVPIPSAKGGGGYNSGLLPSSEDAWTPVGRGWKGGKGWPGGVQKGKGMMGITPRVTGWGAGSDSAVYAAPVRVSMHPGNHGGQTFSTREHPPPFPSRVGEWAAPSGGWLPGQAVEKGLPGQKPNCLPGAQGGGNQPGKGGRQSWDDNYWQALRGKGQWRNPAPGQGFGSFNAQRGGWRG